MMPPMHDMTGFSPDALRRLLQTALAAALTVLSVSREAEAGADHAVHHAQPAPGIIMTVTPAEAVEAGRPVLAVARLRFTDGRAVTPQDLRVMHTERFHLLVIEPTLSDYHHLHPRPAGAPGEYAFSFTPAFSGTYRMWADLTPEATGTQLYAPADMGIPPARAIPGRGAQWRAEAGDLTAVLSLDTPLRAGKASLATIRITQGGKDFTELEPVMGAFAHAVGFAEDYRSILHVHPLGREPERAEERGGPVLQFHLQPPSPGSARLFLQVRTGGQDRFLRFSLSILP